MMASSSWTGQGALQPLPSRSVIHKRNVTTYAMPEEIPDGDKDTLTNEEAGLPVLKVSKNGTLQPRRLAFSRDRRTLLVTSRRIRSVRGLFRAVAGGRHAVATAKEIPILSVDHVDTGPNSKRFLRLQQLLSPVNQTDAAVEEDQRKNLQKWMNHDSCVCLSIVYLSSDNKLESLDLVVPDTVHYEALCQALDDLTALTLEEKQRYTANMQLLHTQWTAMGKEWESPAALADWLTLCDRLQVPLKKSNLSVTFKEQCAEFGDERLPFSEVAMLLEDVKESAVRGPRRDPLLRLWKELVETDPVPAVGLQQDDDDKASLELSLREMPKHESISAVQLLSFIRSKQKKFTTTMEQVTDLVYLLNQQASVDGEGTSDDDDMGAIANRDRLSKGRFMSWLTSDANDIVDPEKARVGADDMTKPLSYYWINTSHDTYLEAQPDSFQGVSAYERFTLGPDEVDAYQYTAALLRGVRCLELDLWDDREEPVVARHPLATGEARKTIPLKTVLRSVRSFLDQNPKSFPIILRLENHCSALVQANVAKYLYEVLGAAQLIYAPPEGKGLEDPVVLPSPQAARGKVLLMGKRPKNLKQGSKVMNDDFDSVNDGWEIFNPSFKGIPFDFEEEENAAEGHVIGFDENGPIRTKDPHVLVRSPKEMLEIAKQDVKRAETDLEESRRRKNDLLGEAEAHEKLTAELTGRAGIPLSEVKQRAALASPRRAGHDHESEHDVAGEEKNSKDEGVEVHEVLPVVVEGAQDRYAEAAEDMLEASNRVNVLAMKLREAEQSLKRAEMDLEMSRQLEENGKNNAKKAAAEARTQWEHADAARERVEQVRVLLENSKSQEASAETVVQTALTEAKISEKRAIEAEARAARGLSAAEKDRFRADQETKKEEELEHEVSSLHSRCKEAAQEVKSAKERLLKATTLYENVDGEIKHIENSSQYRREKNDGYGGPSMDRHAGKLEERLTCRELIKEASEAKAAADSRVHMLKHQFEEKAQYWRSQAELAAQMRKAADRSTHIADELSEHAEEEREAAKLRQVARDKAMAAVENIRAERESVEAQLAEAERAAAEADRIAVQSRHRADRLGRESEKIQDHGRFIEAVAKRKWELKLAQGELDAAKLELGRKHEIAEEEKRRLDTSSLVYRSAEREAASESDRARTEQKYQQEAVIAYNTAQMLRKEAENATAKFEAASSVAEAKRMAAAHAKEYKDRMDMLVEIPPMLAQLTFIHTQKFRDWDTSLASSSACAHNLAQNVLLQMVDSDPEDQDSDPEDQRSNLEAFTKNHLCRVFPPWKAMQSKSFTNCDPVFAWSMGCQLVAMNFHSADENLLVADGRFRQNGSSGYVLKPRYLTDNSSKPEDRRTWSFKVLAGYHLPKLGRGLVGPLVKISLYEGSAKETRVMYKTKVAEPNGLNPVWDDSSYSFTVEKPSIAIIAFSVWHKNDDRSEEFIAGAAFPVSCLREGYRSVCLFNSAHSRSGLCGYSSLLVKAKKSQS